LELESIVGSYTKPEHDAFLSHVCNGGQLNCIFEHAVVTNGPHPVPGTEEFTKAVKKRKFDAIGKNPSKRLMAAGKRKMEAAKVAPSRGKVGLKWPSTAEVALARPLKQSKKAMAHPVAVATTTRFPAGALSSKVAAVASSSKGAASAKKMVMPVCKHHVPAIGSMAAASLKESQEMLLHSQVA
jgi:hypothetical protein